MERAQFARDVDFGRFETGERVFNVHRHRPRWVAKSAQLLAFGEDLTSCEDVYTEGDQDAAPGVPLIGDKVAERRGLLAMLGHNKERF